MRLTGPYLQRLEIAGTFGVAASSHWIASQIALRMLELGGNAFDAAAAAGLVMQVLVPDQCTLGGEAVIIFAPAGAGQATVLCGQGVAPARATISRYRAEGYDLVPGTGLLSAVVPGAFGALLTLFRDFGTLDLEHILEPCIHYAERGFPISAETCKYISRTAELFRTSWTGSAAAFLRGNSAPLPGTLFANPVLARTYRRILEEGTSASARREGRIEGARNAFYNGFVAEEIEKFIKISEPIDDKGRRHRGLLAADDLARWSPSYEPAVTCQFRDYQVCKPGPWSQGPVLLQLLALLDPLPLDEDDQATFVHTIVEALKLAFADREAWYGDPDFVEVPTGRLLSADYNAERRKLLRDTASADLQPGRPDGRPVRMPLNAAEGVGRAAGPTPAAAELAHGGDTCHLDVIDRLGNVVAATVSGGWLQSSPVMPALGFSLSNRAQMFWLEEDLPSSLAPRKRPRTTLSPTLAWHTNGAIMAFGSRGGDFQDQWAAQFFLRYVEQNLGLQASIDSPIFHSEHWPKSEYPRKASPLKLVCQASFSEDTLAGLRQRGHNVKVEERAWGRMIAARRDGELLGAAATAALPECSAIGR